MIFVHTSKFQGHLVAAAQLKSGDIDRERYDELQQEIEWASNLEELKKMNSAYYRIDIAGGEPLMNKTHFKWLEQLPDEQKAKTQLLYNTNGTHRPKDSEVEIWSKFKGVWITFSIDAAYKKFEVLRVNAKWDEVYENMKYCADEIVHGKLKHQAVNGYTNTAIVMTIHKGNILDIFDLYDATKDINWIQRDYINYNYLYYPESMAVHNMTKNMLKQAVSYFDGNLHRLPDNSKMQREAYNLRNSMDTFTQEEKVHKEEHRATGLDAREQTNLEEIAFKEI